MRHIPISILGIVAIVGIATLLLSITYVPVFTPLAVQIVPTYGGAVNIPMRGNTIIVGLDVGEYLSNELTSATESQLDGLRGGTVRGRDFSASYTQNIRFGEPGLFNGCHIVFGRDEQNRVADFLQCDDAIFKYNVDFSPGLTSAVEGNKLPGIEDEDIMLLGETFSIVGSSVNTGSNSISLKFFGGLGSIELEDSNYADDLFTDSGAKVNGQSVHARVKIKASDIGNEVSIYSIQYLLDAEATIGGTVQVLPLHCVREFLQYPLGMLSSSFDICYKGITAPAAVVTDTTGISGNEVRVNSAGDDEYMMIARNLIGNSYKIPLAQLPGMYGNKGRNFVFVEAPNPGAPNINVNDYVLLNSKNDVQGVSNVLMYKGVTDNIAYFDDLSTGSRKASVDVATQEGQLMVGEGTYRFKVGAGNSIAMDQTNDGNINGAEANFVLPGGTRIDFGPGFTVRTITPSKLFSDPAGDEITKFDIVFGGFINLVVPSPQATVPGYNFKMESEGGGMYKGLTKYGILFSWDKETSSSSDLSMIVPGAQMRSVKGGAGAEVYITLERAKLMKPMAAPTAKCGDRIITKPEYCDPPDSICADQFKRPGKCAADCMSCTFKPPAACGNKLLENGEECESAGDCPVGFDCKSCKCVELPKPVCGNYLLEKDEQCEANADCAVGYVCSNCACFPAPPVQAPAANVTQPNILAKFFMWLAGLFTW